MYKNTTIIDASFLCSLLTHWRDMTSDSQLRPWLRLPIMTITADYDSDCELRLWLPIMTLTVKYDSDCQIGPCFPIFPPCVLKYRSWLADFFGFLPFRSVQRFLLTVLDAFVKSSSQTWQLLSIQGKTLRYLDYRAFKTIKLDATSTKTFQVDQMTPTWIHRTVMLSVTSALFT